MRKTLLIMALLVACMGLNAQNYHINLHNGGSVVYDNDVNTIRTCELGSGIEVYAFVTTDPDETFDDYYYNLPIPNEIEYVLREDVNSAYGLTGNHGFKAIVPLLPTSFEDDMEHIFYVKIYAKFNPGTGSQYVVLHSAAVTVRMNLGEGSE